MINFSAFTFINEQIRNINELVYEGILKLPELSELHNNVRRNRLRQGNRFPHWRWTGW